MKFTVSEKPKEFRPFTVCMTFESNEEATAVAAYLGQVSLADIRLAVSRSRLPNANADIAGEITTELWRSVSKHVTGE